MPRASKIPRPGRVLELWTNQPGVQFYSGNFLDGTVTGKYGRVHRQYDALCLEPQVYPNTPNRPDFPSARLDPGQTYRHTFAVSVFRKLRARTERDRMEEVATTTLSEHHCHLGEGCTYDPATDTAWWFDILERTLFQADLASGAVTAHALPVMASVLAFIDDAAPAACDR